MRILFISVALFLASCIPPRGAHVCAIPVIDDGIRHDLEIRHITCSRVDENNWKVGGSIFDPTHDVVIVGLVVVTMEGKEAAISKGDGSFVTPSLSINDSLFLQYPGYNPKTYAVKNLINECIK